MLSEEILYHIQPNITTLIIEWTGVHSIFIWGRRPMTQQDVWTWISNNLVQLILICSVFIQISPLKIDPWSKVLKWVGKIMNADLEKKIEDFTETITDLEKTVDENEKDRIRWEVLDFANSCRNNRRHTKDEFEHIVTLNKKYKRLLKKTDDTNGVFDVEYEYIKELYAERLRKNDFL